MWRGISLANKCLLLFGGAVVLVVIAAMVLPWFRMNALVDDGQLEVSRAMASAWEAAEKSSNEADQPGTPRMLAGIYAARLTLEQADVIAAGDEFVAEALERFRQTPELFDVQGSSWQRTLREYRYIRATRDPGRNVQSVILLDRRSVQAASFLLYNTGSLLSAAFFVLAIAMTLFYFITHKLVLAPVGQLKDTAERVREGDLAIRSDIRTGDEFEELAETFNLMLTDLSAGQDQLRAINRALDLKLTELSEMNSTLFEAAKLKGDFLANVSHELRTPLNSMIGFADLLIEMARSDIASAGGEPTTAQAKRMRYLENIRLSAQNLLEMINDLLDMAKLESGRNELHIERMNAAEVCEGLIGLMMPQAEKKGLTLKLEAAEELPLIETDVKKFQQIVFNFLSNAVKFTPSPNVSGRPEQVTLRAERLTGTAPGGEALERFRVSVIDTGPGIPKDEQERIFDKFVQLSGGHTREHPGTGLGLAICKELASILQGEIQLVSEESRGSMFSLIIPLKLDAEEAAVRKLEGHFRNQLASRKVWM